MGSIYHGTHSITTAADGIKSATTESDCWVLATCVKFIINRNRVSIRSATIWLLGRYGRSITNHFLKVLLSNRWWSLPAPLGCEPLADVNITLDLFIIQFVLSPLRGSVLFLYLLNYMFRFAIFLLLRGFCDLLFLYRLKWLLFSLWLLRRSLVFFIIFSPLLLLVLLFFSRSGQYLILFVLNLALQWLWHTLDGGLSWFLLIFI